jgi:hypothetical protein
MHLAVTAAVGAVVRTTEPARSWIYEMPALVAFGCTGSR